MPATPSAILSVDDRDVVVTNPDKVLFPQAGHTKLDVVRYYLSVADGALRGSGGRPNILVRYPDGIDAEFFFQKRAPKDRPPWIEVVTIRFPSGRTADEIVPRHAADLAWMANLACLELHPHPVRAEDLDHPDELRIDLDPVADVPWSQVREVARVVQAALEDHGLRGWPKTSGKRGLHVLVRIERRWTHDQVRRAALALARDVERRVPDARHQQMVEGRAARRVHRLQPERQGPHRGRRVLDPPDARRARLRAARLERSRRRRSGRFHAGHDAEALRAHRRPASRHRRARVFARQPARAFASVTRATARATRRGRRNTQRRPASRRACSPRVAPALEGAASRAERRPCQRR